MRRMDFTTEHVESFQPGETYEVTECVLPSSYYYVLEHALGISKNFKNAAFKDNDRNSCGYEKNVTF